MAQNHACGLREDKASTSLLGNLGGSEVRWGGSFLGKIQSKIDKLSWQEETLRENKIEM